jgi:hypothetical protein
MRFNVGNHFQDDFLISSQYGSLPTMTAMKPLTWLCVLTSEAFFAPLARWWGAWRTEVTCE